MSKKNRHLLHQKVRQKISVIITKTCVFFVFKTKCVSKCQNDFFYNIIKSVLITYWHFLTIRFWRCKRLQLKLWPVSDKATFDLDQKVIIILYHQTSMYTYVYDCCIHAMENKINFVQSLINLNHRYGVGVYSWFKVWNLLSDFGRHLKKFIYRLVLSSYLSSR